MTNNTLKTRIVLNNKTNAEWTSDTYSATVPLKGEVCIYSDLNKIKIGDGTSTITALPFATLTPDEVQGLISAASHSHSNKSVLDATTASFTTALLTKLNGIADGANKYVLPSANGTTLGGVKTGGDVTITNGVITVDLITPKDIDVICGANILWSDELYV